MKKLFCILAVVFFTSTIAHAASPEKFQAYSAWTNQSGSTLYIDNIESNGLLTGTYINRASGYLCQNISYPVTGWIYGSAITFTTIWKSTTESCNSITSWTGFYYQGQIQTLWQLVISGSSSTDEIQQGADTFTLNVMKKNKSLMKGK